MKTIKFLGLNTLLLAIPSTGFSATYDGINSKFVPSNLGNKVCTVYKHSKSVCSGFGMAIDQAADIKEVMALPVTLMVNNAGGGNKVVSPLPQNLDINSASAWSLRNVASGEQAETITLDKIRELHETKPNLKLAYETFFTGETLFTELKNFLQPWVQRSVNETTWKAVQDVFGDAKDKLHDLTTAVESGSTKIPDIVKDLVSFAVGKEAYFKPEGSSATFYPFYVAWSGLLISVYRAVKCDTNIARQLSKNDLALVNNEAARLGADVKLYGSYVEATYNIWFLASKKYKAADEITNHFQLRFAFDFNIWAENLDKCEYVTTRSSLGASALSALPLFQGSLVDPDNVGGREKVAFDFFFDSMTYYWHVRKLNALKFHLDDDGTSFRGVQMTFGDQSVEVYGDMGKGSNIVNWNLRKGTGTNYELRKLALMEYDFGGQKFNQVFRCSDGYGEAYTMKSCSNKLKVQMEVDGGKTETWTVGSNFTAHPDVSFPKVPKTRFFHMFIGHSVTNSDAEYAKCKFKGQYTTWVGPAQKEQYLDNLLAVYRQGTSDYWTFNM